MLFELRWHEASRLDSYSQSLKIPRWRRATVGRLGEGLAPGMLNYVALVKLMKTLRPMAAPKLRVSTAATVRLPSVVPSALRETLSLTPPESSETALQRRVAIAEQIWRNSIRIT